jgi:hypothetical protein
LKTEENQRKWLAECNVVIQSTYTGILFHLSSMVCHFLSALYLTNLSGKTTRTLDKQLEQTKDLDQKMGLFCNTHSSFFSK